MSFQFLGGIMLQLPLIHIGTRYEIGLTDINGIDNQGPMEEPGMAVFVGDYFISNLDKNSFLKLCLISIIPLSLRSQIQMGIFTHVAENQNQITVLRS